MYLDLGDLYRYLSFQYVYNTIEAEKEFEKFTNDGWFPFIELYTASYIIAHNLFKVVFGLLHELSWASTASAT